MPFNSGKRIALFIILAFYCFTSYGQVDSSDSTRVSDSLVSGNNEFLDVSFKKPKLTPFIAPAYSPETELLFLLGGLFTFKLRPLDPIIQRSSIPFVIGYSTNNSFQTNFRPIIFGVGGKYNIVGDIWIRNQPDHYYGTGYENGRDVELSDSTTRYDRFWWQVEFSLMRTFHHHLQAGIIMDLNKTEASNLNPQMKEDPDFMEGGEKVRNSGFGLVVQYDSRDFAVNPYEGVFVSISSIFYGNFLAGNNIYQIHELEYRQFRTIGRAGRTLGWQVKTRLGAGDVPWPELSQLGTPFDLRGYRWGRYRDKKMLLGLVEYRHMFMRKKPNKKGSLKSRHGFVVWTGTGSIGKKVSDWNKWLPNLGVGYRFEVQDRMNVRVDFGLGMESNGLYVNFNEAF